MNNPFRRELEQFPVGENPSYADGSTNGYILTNNGEEAREAGYSSIPAPVDWLDQYEMAQNAIETVIAHKYVRDKLYKYDPVLFGRLQAVAEHYNNVSPVTDTKMTKKQVSLLARSLKALPISKKTKSVIALTLVPVLRKVKTSFDPYVFMESVIE